MKLINLRNYRSHRLGAITLPVAEIHQWDEEEPRDGCNVTSHQLTVQKNDSVSVVLVLGEVLRFWLRFSAVSLIRHGESVPGNPAAAAGREESGREGGRGPQTWVGQTACEPAAARSLAGIKTGINRGRPTNKIPAGIIQVRLGRRRQSDCRRPSWRKQ